ncbi:MAG: hypothetical protein Q4D15_05430 [Lachnospiraceae bacterium]|nr:hypothetical protein [Lachnospiraceae bacterium]
MKRISPYSQQKTTYIKIITILLTISLIVMLFGCGKNNGTDGQGSSAGGSSSASGNQVIWNAAFKNLFHTDAEMETKFADLVHDVNQTEGAVTLLQTLNNGKVMYITFAIDSMADEIPDEYKGKNLYLQDCILIRGNYPSEELTGLTKPEITNKYKEQLFYGNMSFGGSGGDNEDGKTESLFGFAYSLNSSYTFTGDITVVLPDLSCSKEDVPTERVVPDNYVFHITETPTRQAVEQPIIYNDQTVGKFRLTELNLQLSIFQSEEVEELTSALTLNPSEFVNVRIKLLDSNNQEIDCRMVPNGGSSGGVVTGDFSFDGLVDTSEVCGIQLGDYVIKLN